MRHHYFSDIKRFRFIFVHSFSIYFISYIFLQFVEHMVRNLKDSLKTCNWDAARYCLRFLADLVNCHVVAANSLLQLLDNMLDAAKEDGVPNVSIFNGHHIIIQ